MSRIDDDRDAERLAERLMQARRTEESRKKDKAGAASNFDKLVQSQKTAQQQAAGQKVTTHAQESSNATRSAIAKMLGDADAKNVEGAKSEGTRQDRTQTQARIGARSLDERVKQTASSESDASGRVKETGEMGQKQVGSAQSADQKSSASRSEGRTQDAKAGNARLEERKEGSDSAAASKAGSGGARAEKGDLKTDADKGGGQQGGKDKGGEPMAAASFRFNPALMAPVSVQKKNETQSSDKLRKAAAEIAQKIVERVRVGANALGKMEFQIDLKNDVLGGMSVKVSAKNGKITAVFSGSDKGVLKMLEEQSESLKNALSARGLTLETLKTEAKS